MRILLVTNHFIPEDFRCNDVAAALAQEGHQVTVLTAIPDYPSGRYHRGYGIFRKRRERVGGVKVIRSFIVPRGKGGAVRLFLNYLSSLVCMSVDAFFLALFRRFDAVLVHETSPVTVGVPADIVRAIRRIPMYFWVLDLWPESLQAAGGIRNRAVLGFFSRLTAALYRHSEKILISSRGFEESICAKGDFAGKIVYFPNWADRAMARGDIRLPEGSLPDGFIVMFAGNIGEAQDFESVMAAAAALKASRDIHFVFLGDGRKLDWVRRFVSENGLEATVHLLGRHPLEEMPAYFERADVMLVSLKDTEIFRLTLPAKVQAYMAAGKPVVAMMNGEGPRVVEEAGCGYSVPAGDSAALAALLLRLSGAPREDLVRMGENGLRYCATHFTFGQRMADLNALFKL